MSDGQKTLSIKHPVLLAYLRRLVRTGIYGPNETQAAWKLIHDQIDHLLESGKLERLETHKEHTFHIEKFEDKKAENSP